MIKFLLSFFIAISAFQVSFSQTQTSSDLVSSLSVIRLVSDANLKLNSIYSIRVQHHESEHSALRSAIYAANTELLSIRSLLDGNRSLSPKLISKL